MPSPAAFSLQSYHFFFFLFFFVSHFSVLTAEPAPLLLLPPVSSTPTTIPAFPEQSAVSSACPLRPPDRLLPAVSSSCSSSSSRCCPVLAAWLYASYAPTALSLSPLPAAASAGSGGGELPLLPDDSESCAASAARAIRARGGPAASLLPRIDSCAVRLRRPSCPSPPSPAGRWSPPTPAAARRLQRACSRPPGLAACSRCLRALNQLKTEAAAAAAAGGNATATTMKSKAVGRARGRDCQIMGLTWLLAKNGTRYLPTAAAVFRTFMAADKAAAATTAAGDGKVVDPTTCFIADGDDDDDMPLAVDSAQINGHDKSSAVPSFPPSPPTVVPFLVLGLGLMYFFPLYL